MKVAMWSAAYAFAAVLTATAVVRADERDDARALYDSGKAAYDRGEYPEALTRFSRAYSLHPVPALLFNMAQASRLSGKGHCAEALDLYERYLERDPAPENRTEVEERITQMRACARDEPASAQFHTTEDPHAVAPAPQSGPNAPPALPPAPAVLPVASSGTPPPPRAEKPATGHSVPIAAVLATGLGAALAISGGVLYLQARSKFDDARAVCPCPKGTYSDWETLTTVSYVLMATGVVVSGTGAAFWIISGKSDAPATTVSGAGLRFTGRF